MLLDFEFNMIKLAIFFVLFELFKFNFVTMVLNEGYGDLFRYFFNIRNGGIDGY